MAVMIEELMGQLVADGGSDLHISTGLPPYGRFNGQLRPMQAEILEEEACQRLSTAGQLCRLPEGPGQ